MKKTVKILSIAAVICAMVVVAFSVFMPNFTKAEQVFETGETMQSVNIEGLSVKQATDAVSNNIKNTSGEIIMACGNKEYVCYPNLNAVPSLISNILVQKIKDKNVSAKISVFDVYPTLNQEIDNLIQENNIQPVDAKVVFNPDGENMFEITPSKMGLCVDKEQLIFELEQNFKHHRPLMVDVKMQEVEPQTLESDFVNKLDLMGSFTTSLKNSQEGRKHNVALALSKINGLVVNSGETVSFNNLTSPQTAENGYANAIIILNGKFTEGVGGGICQASTTVYNACVLANLEINEVHKHTLPVGYVELAFDAMVSEGTSDFVFTNNSVNPIYIKAGVSGDDAYCEIYGRTLEQNQKIEREFELVDTIKPEEDEIIVDKNGEYSDKVLYKGEYFRLKYPKDGYEAKAYKTLIEDGVEIERTLIRHEIYKAVPGVVVEGAGELPEGWEIPKENTLSAVASFN